MKNYLATKIALTGATGFVGSHLLPHLLENGAEVTCIVRKSSNKTKLPSQVKIVEADLLTGDGLASALQGQTIFVHLAALLFGLRFSDYLEANVQAAQSICKTLQDLGDLAPKKVLLVSSQAASGPSKADLPTKDDCNSAPVSGYGWSKLLAERTFQSLYQGQLAILRPSIIYGSGDRGLLPLFQGIKKGFAVSPGFGRSFPVSIVHAEDMAQAILLALSPKASGIYHVCDDQKYTMDQFCQAIGQALGRPKTHVFHIPLPIMFFSALLAQSAANVASFVTKKYCSANWNLDKYREAKQAGWLCSSQRLKDELGFSPKFSLDQGMVESVAGYQKLGWL
ncbi:MAG: NAD(P)-dependent oxidoreductase [Desulfovibrionaceae bacterium]|nr:NAD(P)-dependent oxidoreductase [Desulfovibrionaceae bacterium]